MKKICQVNTKQVIGIVILLLGKVGFKEKILIEIKRIIKKNQHIYYSQSLWGRGCTQARTRRT